MKLLFLSGLDFKAKSIQVIRKTPEAYVAAGHEVTYVAFTDRGARSDYFYEPEINPPGVDVHRVRFSTPGFLDRSSFKWLARLVNKFKSLIYFVPAAIWRGAVLHRKNKYDVFYGYEIYGAIAAKFLSVIFRKPFVSRFQGTLLTPYVEKKQLLQLLRRAEHVLALRMSSDLCIMTDDGTKGDRVLTALRARHRKVLFLRNGVDKAQLTQTFDGKSELRRSLGGDETQLLVLLLSRLVGWKRVDRAIASVSFLSASTRERVRFAIVGEGADRARLEQLSKDLGCTDVIRFVGAVKNDEVYRYYQTADVFLSLYDLSNLGNPFFESQTCGLPIIALDCGDTRSCVTDGVNGLLVSHRQSDEAISRDVAARLEQLVAVRSQLENLARGSLAFARDHLNTWERRFELEVSAVEELKC